MLTYPAVVAVISLVFAVMVFQQFRQRKGWHQLAWSFALFLSFAGSLAYLLAAWFDAPIFFRLYYITGALMMAAYLGVGSLYLAAPRTVAHAAAGLVTAGSLIGAFLIWQAPLDETVMAAQLAAGGSGAGVMTAGTWQVFTRTLNFFGALAVIGVALHSAAQLYRNNRAGAFLTGNLLIALGVFLNAAAGFLTRMGIDGFWLIMALGTGVLFAGFLVIEQRTREMGAYRSAAS